MKRESKDGTHTLLGAAGWGSAITEAMLDLSGIPYRLELIDPEQEGPSRSAGARSIRSSSSRRCSCPTDR